MKKVLFCLLLLMPLLVQAGLAPPSADAQKKAAILTKYDIAWIKENTTPTDKKGQRKLKKHVREADIPSDLKKFHHRKSRLIKIQSDCCTFCGVPYWLGCSD